MSNTAQQNLGEHSVVEAATASTTPSPSVAAAAPAATQSKVIAQPPAVVSRRKSRRWIFSLIGISVLLSGAWVAPMVKVALNTVSTDDAYVNGHVTVVAPRVVGQVQRVLVDDNQRVKPGDILVQLDKEPYELQVAIKRAALGIAESDLQVASANVQSGAAQTRGYRFNLQHAIESVHAKVALLRSNVAQLHVDEANLVLAERDYVRNKPLVEKRVIAPAEFDEIVARRDSARSRVSSSTEIIQQTRAELGLPINQTDPLDVPKDLDQTFSVVRQSLGQLMQSAASFGYFAKSWDMSPQETLKEFLSQDPQGDLNKIYANLIAHAPAVKQAEAKVEQAKRDLDQAKLNLKYCDVVCEIEGMVTRRNVNPGNNVQAGQSLMAVRSLTEVWIDANFKETELADLRIGQRVVCEVDMYGRRHEFQGRISGFTMGTGQTLALLPPQNATGNFVKIVQRLPVRIELTDYKPDEAPLFVGLSVTPYVYYKESPTGKNAGAFLQALEVR